MFVYYWVTVKIYCSCAPYVTPPDDILILKIAHDIYLKFDQYPSALQVALKLNDMELIKSDFNTCPDP